MFNAIKYSKELEDAGFTREQAEVTIGVFYKFMDYNFATKDDFHKEASFVRSKFANIENEFASVRNEFALVRNEFTLVRSEILNLEHRMIIKLGLMQVATLAFLTTLQKML
jgi:hypothetical protein